MATRRPKQLSFFPPQPKFFGGALLKGRRKKQRPLAFKKPVHLVLHSEKARGRMALMDYRNRPKILRWLEDFGRRNGVRLFEVCIHWNHVHIAAKFPGREEYNKFIRSFTGTVPKVVLGFAHPTETFWDFRPFTRIVEWGRDFRGVCDYVTRNTLEALRHIRTGKRRDPYSRFLRQSGAFPNDS